MKTALLALAAVLPVHALAARVQEPQQVMALDLDACPRPAYPAVALAAGIGGKTTVEVQIGSAGLVTEARILASSGRTDLDDAALAGIRRCMFHAVLATGQAPTGWLKTEYVWKPGDARRNAVDDQARLTGTRTLAEAGDAHAQNTLGAWYERGLFVPADLAQAAAWYLRAAEGGNAAAQNNLGVLYSRGAGVPKDLRQAAYWYAKAADQGHGWGQANLALAYQRGVFGQPDLDKAQYWLTRAAEGGHAYAQVGLGLLAMQRAATDAERAAAAAWFARAAAQDAPPGLYYLGRSFESGLGNPQDDARAAELYRKVGKRSEGRAETALGQLVEAGRAGAADQDAAAKLYQEGMQARYPAAFYRYGLVLERRGETDLASAVFRQGAELGDCDAVLKYLQMPPVAGAAAASAQSGAALAQRAAWCKARPPMPAAL